jgi:hypothetical protein
MDVGGFSEDGGRVKFDENLRNSPFNKDLSIETTFSLIHLAGQYTFKMTISIVSSIFREQQGQDGKKTLS